MPLSPGSRLGPYEVTALLGEGDPVLRSDASHLSELPEGPPQPRKDLAVIGQRLGPYEVLSKLGEVGMGEVYRATDRAALQ